MKSNKLLILGILAWPIFLSACGGGSGSSANTANTINGITVPPAPDPVANSSTLAGVDSNKNGVRDDVERKIAINATQGQFDNSIAIAREYQKLVSDGGLNGDEISAINLRIQCLSLKPTVLNSKEIGKFVADNNDRTKEIRRATLQATGGFFDSENNCK